MEPSDESLREYLNVVGERRIDEDIQNKLREILKCGVCYEIPMEKELKIRTCEQGHHFCSGCFRKLRHCGICRGQFHFGRNFVVEDIITQLGSSFGLTKTEIPVPLEPANLVPGSFSCLHQCSSKVMAVNMLEHIRKIHAKNLFDDVRSNPYLKVFSCTYQIPFTLEKFLVSSFQISDMGLFTVVISINSTHFLGSAHMLANPPVLYEFQCKLTIKINKFGHANEFSVSDCDLFGYNYDREFVFQSERALKLDLSTLFTLTKVGDNIQVLFSVWRKSAAPNRRNNDYTQITILPDETAIFRNDRRQRRNKLRNMRKKKNRQALRERRATDELLNRFKNISLVF